MTRRFSIAAPGGLVDGWSIHDRTLLCGWSATGTHRVSMRDESEIREQYEFLAEELDSEEMRHDGVREMFTYYKRALGWVLEEEHI